MSGMSTSYKLVKKKEFPLLASFSSLLPFLISSCTLIYVQNLTSIWFNIVCYCSYEYHQRLRTEINLPVHDTRRQVIYPVLIISRLQRSIRNVSYITVWEPYLSTTDISPFNVHIYLQHQVVAPVVYDKFLTSNLKQHSLNSCSAGQEIVLVRKPGINRRVHNNPLLNSITSHTLSYCPHIQN
jgi:hypothetical protein